MQEKEEVKGHRKGGEARPDPPPRLPAVRGFVVGLVASRKALPTTHGSQDRWAGDGECRKWWS